MGYFALGSKVYVQVYAVVYALLFWSAVTYPSHLLSWGALGFVLSLVGMKMITALKFFRLRLWRLVMFMTIHTWATLVYAFMIDGMLYVYISLVFSLIIAYLFLSRVYHYRHSDEGAWGSMMLSSLPVFIFDGFATFASLAGARVFFGVSWWWLSIGIAVFVYILSYIMLWFWAIASYERYSGALVASLILVELFLVLQLLPLSIFVNAALLVIAWIIYLNALRLVHAHGEERSMWVRFVYAGTVSVLIMLVTSSWR